MTQAIIRSESILSREIFSKEKPKIFLLYFRMNIIHALEGQLLQSDTMRINGNSFTKSECKFAYAMRFYAHSGNDEIGFILLLRCKKKMLEQWIVEASSNQSQLLPPRHHFSITLKLHPHLSISPGSSQYKTASSSSFPKATGWPAPL